MSLEKKLQIFLADLPIDNIVDKISSKSELSPSDITQWLQVYINETKASLAVVAPFLQKEQRALEVGAGLCLLSLFLKSEGFNIVADEPALGGFDLFAMAKEVVAQHYASLHLEVITCPAAGINVADHGSFDLVFSNNVLEHIPDLADTLLALAGVLAAHGKMVHNCPNYIFPYEPHLAIPVIKPIKVASEFIFRKKISKKQGLWDSLNFVTYFDITRFARDNNFNIEFESGLLFEAFNRLGNDPIFFERHNKSLIIWVYKILKYSRLLFLLRYFPPMLTSPMQFQLVYQDENHQ